MAQEASALIGSGTVEFTKNILTPEQRGSNADSRGGFRTGTQVMVGNPEDINAVDAFGVSGVTVGSATPVELVGPHTNPLPRCREVRIINDTPSTKLFIGPRGDLEHLTSQGYVIEHGSGGAGDHPVQTALPLLHNVSVWAIADTGDIISVRILVL
jgi:hypothetical protein